MLNVAVLVSGGGTNLQALIDAEGEGRFPLAKLSLVIASKADAYALERAKAAGIPGRVAKKEKGMPIEAYGELLLSLLSEHHIHMVVLAGFLTILPSNVIKAYEGRMINVHPSLIPSFCGAGYYGLKVHEAALDYGVKVTGATVHYVNEVPDGGKIIFQKAVSVMEDDTPEILQRRVMEEAEWQLLPAAVAKVSEEIAKSEAH